MYTVTPVTLGLFLFAAVMLPSIGEMGEQQVSISLKLTGVLAHDTVGLCGILCILTHQCLYFLFAKVISQKKSFMLA